MRKRKQYRIYRKIAILLADEGADLGDGAHILLALAVAGLIAEGGHDKQEWLDWIGQMWDYAEKEVPPDKPKLRVVK